MVNRYIFLFIFFKKSKIDIIVINLFRTSVKKKKKRISSESENTCLLKVSTLKYVTFKALHSYSYKCFLIIFFSINALTKKS